MGFELPDTYWTRQAAAIGAAIRAGDDTRAEQLRRHLVAEGSEDPDSSQDLDQFTALAGPFYAMLSARERGDHAEADRIAKDITSQYPREAIEFMVAMQLLAAGVRDGELPADQYDRLVELLADADLSDIYAEPLACIRRMPS